MIRLLSCVLTLSLLCGGGYWIKERYPPAEKLLSKILHSSSIQIIEPGFSLDYIIEKTGKKHSPLSAEVRYYPYAVLEVKYSRSPKKTEEAFMLWSLTNAELVLSTKTWQTTHGFQDCLIAKSDHMDIKILKSLSAGPLSRQKIAAELHLENEELGVFLQACCAKKLIIHREHDYRVHLDTPYLTTRPITKLEIPLTYKPMKSLEPLPQRYPLESIVAFASSIFKDDFCIRSSQQVYLPVYCLTFQGDEGPATTSYWNSLNGRELKL
ncbi:MAG: hypothetical protein WCN87_04810 [Chlamydiota bacterium]